MPSQVAEALKPDFFSAVFPEKTRRLYTVIVSNLKLSSIPFTLIVYLNLLNVIVACRNKYML